MVEFDISKTLIFFLVASFAIFFALFSIFVRRIVHSLICAVVTFLSVAFIFFMLGADYNGVVQISLYGIAIPILFILAIMFTSYRKDKFIYLANSPRLYIAFFAIGLLFVSLTYLITTALSLSSNSNWILQKQTMEINKYQLFKALADGLFSNYVLTFEIFSLLLLVIVVGLSTLNLKGDKSNNE